MVQGPPTRRTLGLRLLAVALAGVAQGWALAWPFGVAQADWLMPASAWLNLWPQPGQPWPALQVVAMAAWLVCLHHASTGRAAFATGWVFACAGLTSTFWWLFISMHTYGGLPAPLAVLAVVALAGALALYGATISWLFWHLPLVGYVLSALFFASLWTVAELARGVWFTGFPWGAVGYAHVNSLGWAAPWVGVYGMGALAVCLAVGLAQAWRSQALSAKRRAAKRALALVAVLAVLASGPAVQRVLPGFTHAVGELPLVLLQGNIAQDEKFQPGTGLPRALAAYAAGFTRQAVDASPTQPTAPARAPLAAGTLVVAPETALPLLPQQLGAAYWQPVLSALAGQQHAVITGLPLGNAADGYANAMWGITPVQAGRAIQRLADGASPAALDEGDGAVYRYAKHHLVPFGEFIPPMARWFVAMMNIPLGDFNRGALKQLSFEWAGQRIAPNICYEDLFGEELAQRFANPAQAPTVMVNLSNLGWFGNTVALDQHLHISRLRALELERPMVRATNTGATVVVNHLGQVTHAHPRALAGELAAMAVGRDGLTPYARWAGQSGLWWAWVCAGAGSLAGVWLHRLQARQRSHRAGDQRPPGAQP